jgi:hypothetical protein
VPIRYGTGDPPVVVNVQSGCSGCLRALDNLVLTGIGIVFVLAWPAVIAGHILARVVEGSWLLQLALIGVAALVRPSLPAPQRPKHRQRDDTPPAQPWRGPGLCT